MRLPRWLPVAAVALVAAVLYFPTIGFGFVFDDDHLIVSNAFVREPWSAARAFVHDFWHGSRFAAGYYRPLVTSSLALNGRVLGWGPAGFHLVNVLIHALNAALVLILARRLRLGAGAAVASAALFAVHPAAAWAVASIVARVDLLPCTFVLLAWIAWTRWTDRSPGTIGGPAPGPGRWRGAFPVAAAFLAALLSKESAVAFLAVPFLDSPEGRPGSGRPCRLGASARGLVALSGGLLAYLGLRLAAGVGLLVPRDAIDPLVNPLAWLPATERATAGLELAGRYLAYLLVPQGFSDPHGYHPGDGQALVAAGPLLALALLAGWGLVVLWLWLRRDRLAAPLGFALAAFLPASNLIAPIGSLYAQNFLYMPLLGLALASGMVVDRVAGRLAAKQTPVARRPWAWIGTGLAAVLAVGSAREAAIWKDEVALFNAWTNRFPNYAVAWSRLGVALIGAGRPVEAVPPLRRALTMREEQPEAHYNLGVALLITGQGAPEWREALDHSRRAAALMPDLAPARVNASRLEILLGHPVEAENEARAALQLAPDLEPARRNLAEALFQQQRYPEAAELFQGLLASHPRDPDLLSPFIVSLIHAGRFEEARRQAEAARAALPALAWFDFCLARVEARSGSGDRALALLGIAVGKEPMAREWIGRVNDFERYRKSPAFIALLSRPSR